MSNRDYSELENRFHCACQDVIGELASQYKTNYHGTGKLEAFFALIQSEFERIVEAFTHNNELSQDKEAQRRIQSIAKEHAKQCIGYYTKLN